MQQYNIDSFARMETATTIRYDTKVRWAIMTRRRFSHCVNGQRSSSPQSGITISALHGKKKVGGRRDASLTEEKTRRGKRSICRFRKNLKNMIRKRAIIFQSGVFENRWRNVTVFWFYEQCSIRVKIKIFLFKN